jgi:hypothetical protein
MEAKANFADLAFGLHHLVEHEMVDDHHGVDPHLRVWVVEGSIQLCSEGCHGVGPPQHKVTQSNTHRSSNTCIYNPAETALHVSCHGVGEKSQESEDHVILAIRACQHCHFTLAMLAHDIPDNGTFSRSRWHFQFALGKIVHHWLMGMHNRHEAQNKKNTVWLGEKRPAAGTQSKVSR